MQLENSYLRCLKFLTTYNHAAARYTHGYLSYNKQNGSGICKIQYTGDTNLEVSIGCMSCMALRNAIAVE